MRHNQSGDATQLAEASTKRVSYGVQSIEVQRSQSSKRLREIAAQHAALNLEEFELMLGVLTERHKAGDFYTFGLNE